MVQIQNIPFNSVTYNYMGDVTARVNRKTKDLSLNPFKWFSLDDQSKRFIALHEEGHFVLKTKDEEKANNYAALKFIRPGHEIEDTEYLKKIQSYLSSDNYKQFKKDYYEKNPEFADISVYSNVLDPVSAVNTGLNILGTFLGFGSKKNAQIKAFYNKKAQDYYQNLNTELSNLNSQEKSIEKSKETNLIILGLFIITAFGLTIYLTKNK